MFLKVPKRVPMPVCDKCPQCSQVLNVFFYIGLESTKMLSPNGAKSIVILFRLISSSDQGHTEGEDERHCVEAMDDK